MHTLHFVNTHNMFSCATATLFLRRHTSPYRTLYTSAYPLRPISSPQHRGLFSSTIPARTFSLIERPNMSKQISAARSWIENALRCGGSGELMVCRAKQRFQAKQTATGQEPNTKVSTTHNSTKIVGLLSWKRFPFVAKEVVRSRRYSLTIRNAADSLFDSSSLTFNVANDVSPWRRGHTCRHGSI